MAMSNTMRGNLSHKIHRVIGGVGMGAPSVELSRSKATRAALNSSVDRYLRRSDNAPRQMGAAYLSIAARLGVGGNLSVNPNASANSQAVVPSIDLFPLGGTALEKSYGVALDIDRVIDRFKNPDSLKPTEYSLLALAMFSNIPLCASIVGMISVSHQTYASFVMSLYTFFGIPVFDGSVGIVTNFVLPPALCLLTTILSNVGCIAVHKADEQRRIAAGHTKIIEDHDDGELIDGALYAAGKSNDRDLVIFFNLLEEAARRAVGSGFPMESFQKILDAGATSGHIRCITPWMLIRINNTIVEQNDAMKAGQVMTMLLNSAGAEARATFDTMRDLVAHEKTPDREV